MRRRFKPPRERADARSTATCRPVAMPDRRTHARSSRRPIHAVVVVLSCIAALLVAPLASARTIEFTEAAPRIDLGDVPQPRLGVTGTVKFRTDRFDRRELAAARRQEQLGAQADERTEAATRADQRIAAIQLLLDEVQDDEARLREVVQERLVERYKEGDDRGVQFLLSGEGLSDLVARGQVLKDQSARDRRVLEEYEVTVERVELYRQVLEQLRDINGTQASDLRDRADRVEEVLVAARQGHDEAPLDAPKPKGVGGAWYVMDGAFTAQLFIPSAGTGYTGGSRTPARASTPAQIQAVLSDARIDLDASGYQDVLTSQIDGRILDAMLAAAQRFGYIKITSLKRDHGVYTSSGNVSAHAYGCAMDIGTIGSTWITPGSQTAGGEVHQAVTFFAGLGALKPDLAPHQVISLFDLGGATLAMGDHGDHIHVGYSC